VNQDNFLPRSIEEKGIYKFIKKHIDKVEDKLPEVFYDFIVDIYPTSYGRQCHITALTSKPFNSEVSEIIFEILRFIRNKLEDMFEEKFDSTHSSISTIDSYLDKQNWYKEQKTKTINESTPYFRRRFNAEDLEVSFSNSLDFVSDKFKANKHKWKFLDLKKFSNIIVSKTLEDMQLSTNQKILYSEFENIFSFVKKLYFDRMEQRYNDIINDIY